jgi:phosphate transport system substrate-binding protein
VPKSRSAHRRERGIVQALSEGHRSVALRYRKLLAVATAVPLVLMTACSGGGSASSGSTSGLSSAFSAPGGPIPATPAPGSQTLSETGSTLLAQLMGTWATAYHRQYPNVSITTAATGSGKGISEASAGKVDIGASDAYLSSGDLVQNPTLMNIPLAISAQQVNYYLPGLPTGVHLRLDGAVLAQMYQGTITTWNDPAIRALNPKVAIPGTRVVPIHRSDSSGDTFLFTSYLSTHSPAWNRAIGYGTTVVWPPASSVDAKGNSGMLTACQDTVGCVAYIGISFLNEARNKGLGWAQLANTLGQYELPSAATISAAVASFVSSTPANETISMVGGPASGGYPIVNYEYAIVSVRQRGVAAARDIKAFLHWIITTGNSAQYLAGVQFQPLPASVVSLCDAQIAKIS